MHPDDDDLGCLPLAVLETLRKLVAAWQLTGAPRTSASQWQGTWWSLAGRLCCQVGRSVPNLPYSPTHLHPHASTGFCRRLGESVQHLARSLPKYRDVVSVVEGGGLCVALPTLCPRNIMAWVGGSILATLEVGLAKHVRMYALCY
jgi:hypothetical protein